MKKINETVESYYEIMDSIPSEGSKNVTARNIVGRLVSIIEQDLPDIFKKATCLQTDDCHTNDFKVCKIDCGKTLYILHSDEAAAIYKTKNNVSTIRVNGEGIKINTSIDISVLFDKNSVKITLPGKEGKINYTVSLTVEEILAHRDLLEYTITKASRFVSTIRREQADCVKLKRITC